MQPLLSALGVSLALSLLPAQAGPLRDWIAEKQAARHAETGHTAPEEIAYGPDPRQRFDLYRPTAQPMTDVAPVIFMVHGGGWRLGDKAMGRVVDNKVARWLPKGFVLISTNYRLLPEATPLEQARDIARALAVAQAQAEHWGADRRRFILMGHSAGAHLISLLNARPDLIQPGTTPWLGSVALDSAAFDVTAIMQARHLPLYDEAFGQDPKQWRALSPLHQLERAAPPLLAVCSSRREEACPQAKGFAAKAAKLGMACEVLEKDLSHAEINQQLGEEPRYTAEVEAFLRRLDPQIARRLQP